MSIYTFNPHVKIHSQHTDIPSLICSIGNIEGSYSLEFDTVKNLGSEELLQECTVHQTRSSIYEGLFMFYAAIQHCKGITPIKDHSHDVSEALEDIHDLINIIMHSHFIALDIKRYDEDIINYGLNDTEFDEAGALALIQPYHYLELPMIDRLWFVGRPFHQSDLPKYLKLAGDTERWIKKCRKGCNQVFRALSIQHLQMHGLDFDEDYLTEKNFDLSISFSHPIVEKLLSGELVTMDHLTNAYNKILEENKSNVITLK